MTFINLDDFRDLNALLKTLRSCREFRMSAPLADGGFLVVAANDRSAHVG